MMKPVTISQLTSQQKWMSVGKNVLRMNTEVAKIPQNINRKYFSEDKSFPPSHKFNEKQTNPTTIRDLLRQLLFPSKSFEDSISNTKENDFTIQDRIRQLFSLVRNPGLHESLYRLKQRTISISAVTKDSNHYDYIIVGAGSAGCALAYRLATSHLDSTQEKLSTRKKVLLIEAGPKDTNPWIHIPVGYFKTLHNPKIGWGYKIEDETSGLNGRGIAWPRAKVLGGCSSVNGLLWVRGIPQDYDNWDEVSGNHGLWTWNVVKECFKKLEGHMTLRNNTPTTSEDKEDQDEQRFGSEGPITISDTRYKTGLCNAFIRACEKELKLIKRTREKINILQEEKESERAGFCSVIRSVGMGVVGYFQLTTNYGFRSSAAVGYLNKANRLGENISLDVLTGFNVNRVLFVGNSSKSPESSKEPRAIGVEVSPEEDSKSILGPTKSGNNNKFKILLNESGRGQYFPMILILTYVI